MILILQGMVARHDALRTRYASGPSGTWVPKVAEPNTEAARVPFIQLDLGDLEVGTYFVGSLHNATACEYL